jgi:TIR domain
MARMKIFVSWSGKSSHKVALAFKEWLPFVIQAIELYVSSEDIQKGARWSPEIEGALAEARFGIICLTAENRNAPWLNFEAGALSKVIQNSQTNVCPFLFDLKRSDVEGPLAQFQSVLNEKDDVFKLILTINAAAKPDVELRPEVVKKTFEHFWPELETTFRKIAKEHSKVLEQPRTMEDLLEESVELLRAQQRLGASKEDIAELANLIRQGLFRLSSSSPAAVLSGSLNRMATPGTVLDLPGWGKSGGFFDPDTAISGGKSTTGLRRPPTPENKKDSKKK